MWWGQGGGGRGVKGQGGGAGGLRGRGVGAGGLRGGLALHPFYFVTL